MKDVKAAVDDLASWRNTGLLSLNKPESLRKLHLVYDMFRNTIDGLKSIGDALNSQYIVLEDGGVIDNKGKWGSLQEEKEIKHMSESSGVDEPSSIILYPPERHILHLFIRPLHTRGSLPRSIIHDASTRPKTNQGCSISTL